MAIISQPYKYVLKEEFVFEHKAFKGITFQAEYLTIKDGKMYIPPTYAWNGCSPNFVVLGIAEIGTPDGVIVNGYPMTYWASLAHDALTQYRKVLNIKRSGATDVFSTLLKRAEFPLEILYTAMVKLFSPRDFLGDK
jgi:hypothetical protein